MKLHIVIDHPANKVWTVKSSSHPDDPYLDDNEAEGYTYNDQDKLMKHLADLVDWVERVKVDDSGGIHQEKHKTLQ